MFIYPKRIPHYNVDRERERRKNKTGFLIIIIHTATLPLQSPFLRFLFAAAALCIIHTFTYVREFFFSLFLYYIFLMYSFTLFLRKKFLNDTHEKKLYFAAILLCPSLSLFPLFYSHFLLPSFTQLAST